MAFSLWMYSGILSRISLGLPYILPLRSEFDSVGVNVVLRATKHLIEGVEKRLRYEVLPCVVEMPRCFSPHSPVRDSVRKDSKERQVVVPTPEDSVLGFALPVVDPRGGSSFVSRRGDSTVE